jgi:Transposase
MRLTFNRRYRVSIGPSPTAHPQSGRARRSRQPALNYWHETTVTERYDNDVAVNRGSQGVAFGFDRQEVKNATAGCAHLERLHQHVRSFAKIMAQRRGTELPAWLEAVEADDLPELRSLAAGLRRDLAAVINGLTLEHSSGAVEGNVTRVKRIKRDSYGRANFDLLRAQILIAA